MIKIGLILTFLVLDEVFQKYYEIYNDQYSEQATEEVSVNETLFTAP